MFLLKKIASYFVCMPLCICAAFAQKKDLPTPKNYTAHFTTDTIVIDGKLNDAAWQKAPWTDNFKDILGHKAALLHTKVKMLWHKDCLLIAAKMEDDNVWANIEKRDQIIYRNNDFEVFVSPSNSTRNYFEIEVNALNTILDLFMPKPYRDGGQALISWNVQGLRSAVAVQGTINNAADKDTGWTVEMAIPFAALQLWGTKKHPENGTIWRINFSRVQWQFQLQQHIYSRKQSQDKKLLPEQNWVWSPQGIKDMHYPERWGYLRFATQESTTFEIPLAEKQKNLLWPIYYLQKIYRNAHGHYAASFKELAVLDTTKVIDGQRFYIKLFATPFQFMVALLNKNKEYIYTLKDDGSLHTNTQKTKR